MREEDQNVIVQKYTQKQERRRGGRYLSERKEKKVREGKKQSKMITHKIENQKKWMKK